MSSDNNTGCGKVALLLGAIASLIAIFIFITGKQSLPEFLGGPNQEQALSVPSTQRSAQIKVQTPPPTLRPTDTPIPKPTPTKTPIPSPTLLPTTQPGSILEVGQTWRGGSLELALYDLKIYPEGIVFDFLLTNMAPQDRGLRYSLENFSAIDNLGRRIPVGFDSGMGDYFSFEDCRPVSEILPALGSITLYSSCPDTQSGLVWSGTMALLLDTTDPSVSEVIIKVSISDINEARWRIPIHH